MTPKEKSNKFFDLSVQLANHAKAQFMRVPVENLEESISAYLSILDEESGGTVEVDKDTLKQMSLLSAGALARMIASKYRAKQ